MAITVKDWRDVPDTTTPLNAVALEDLETRMGAYTDAQIAAIPASGGGAVYRDITPATKSGTQTLTLSTSWSPADLLVVDGQLTGNMIINIVGSSSNKHQNVLFMLQRDAAASFTLDFQFNGSLTTSVSWLGGKPGVSGNVFTNTNASAYHYYFATITRTGALHLRAGDNT